MNKPGLYLTIDSDFNVYYGKHKPLGNYINISVFKQEVKYSDCIKIQTDSNNINNPKSKGIKIITKFIPAARYITDNAKGLIDFRVVPYSLAQETPVLQQDLIDLGVRNILIDLAYETYYKPKIGYVPIIPNLFNNT